MRKLNTDEITESEVSALIMSDLIEARVWRESDSAEIESSFSIDEEDEEGISTSTKLQNLFIHYRRRRRRRYHVVIHLATKKINRY